MKRNNLLTISVLLSIFCLLSSCSKASNNEEKRNNPANNQSQTSNQSQQQIDLMKDYVLSNYLNRGFCIYFPELYFAIQNDKSSQDFTYSVSSFLPEKFVDKVAHNDEGFIKLNSNSIPDLSKTGLKKDDLERYWFRIRLEYPFFVKDFLDLLEDSKNKDYVYFVYGTAGGGSYILPPGLKVANENEHFEESMMSTAIKIFDDKHNYLTGYYHEFNICLASQASGEKDYSFKDLLPSFYTNSEASFEKIEDNFNIAVLDGSLPSEAEKTKRDWYRVTFPYKFEAQYALQLFKELEMVSGIFYATTSLDNNDSLDVQIPQFRIWG